MSAACRLCLMFCADFVLLPSEGIMCEHRVLPGKARFMKICGLCGSAQRTEVLLLLFAFQLNLLHADKCICV